MFSERERNESGWARGLRGAAAVIAAAAAALVVAACGGGGGAASGGSGSLRLALTDAPSCGYDAVHVTLQKVRVHQSGSAGENDGGWSEITLMPARRIELLSLTNGVLEELGQTALPAGKYTQMRLVLAPNDGSMPSPNAVTPTGGAETALTTPSGQQSGLKSNIDIDVAAGSLADFVIDFKVCESIVRRGNSGQFNLKPVIAMLPRLSDAGSRVVGYLDAGMVPADTVVSLQRNGVPVRATPPEAGGRFVLSQVAEGSYDLVVNAKGRVTALVTGVPVTPTAITILNTEAMPINPPPATKPRTATGQVVVTGATTVDASVRISKAFSGGPTVELVAAPVDGMTGAFSHPLPGDAPLRAAFVASGTPLGFAADATTPTGLYTVQASSGALTKSISINLTDADSNSVLTLP